MVKETEHESRQGAASTGKGRAVSVDRRRAEGQAWLTRWRCVRRARVVVAVQREGCDKGRGSMC